MSDQWIEDLSNLRENYELASLNEEGLTDDPLWLFRQWLQQAVEHKLPDPNAMVLSTAGVDARPSSRVVLLKHLSSRGFVFFTNYESRKGREISENPYASLCFFWLPLQRQLRVEGKIRKLEDDLSDNYFNSRPEGSRLGTWVSPQSRKIGSREELIQGMIRVRERFREQALLRPPYWGGYILEPDVMEFWQGRPDRLHDRFLFECKQNRWSVSRLAP